MEPRSLALGWLIACVTIFGYQARIGLPRFPHPVLKAEKAWNRAMDAYHTGLYGLAVKRIDQANRMGMAHNAESLELSKKIGEACAWEPCCGVTAEDARRFVQAVESAQRR